MPNFSPNDGPAAAARNYDAATLTRLATLASSYDPDAVIAASLPIREADLEAD